ncbi:MAG: homocysteine S-methyltransferase family protein [Candidatus Lambdaproteobacteria bacterium]|nr:homocysteine S-methyltransferase family protein [Candidatus Lambdaproteobacteria bacterium]
MQLTPPILADGSVHTELRALLSAACPHPVCCNEREPELVRRIHNEYARAGARALRTNTRGANRIEMGALGLAGRCEAFNNAGSALAFDVAGREGIRMGTIGAIGTDGTGADARPDERDLAYGEQAIYLSDTGVTFFLLEHFDEVDEVLRLLRVVRRNSDAPVLAQLRFDAAGRTSDGLTAAQAAERLAGAGADALGVSCGPGFAHLPPIVDALLGAGLPVSLMPGLAQAPAEPPFPGAGAATPEEFAAAMLPFIRQGVAIAGGCCGVSPAHIAALARAVAGTGAPPAS